MGGGEFKAVGDLFGRKLLKRNAEIVNAILAGVFESCLRLGAADLDGSSFVAGLSRAAVQLAEFVAGGIGGFAGGGDGGDERFKLGPFAFDRGIYGGNAALDLLDGGGELGDAGFGLGQFPAE